MSRLAPPVALLLLAAFTSAAPAAAAEQVSRTATANNDNGVVTLTVDGQKVLQYQGRPTELPEGYDPSFRRGGYIHPLYTPSGKVVTDDYPPNHKHHHGVWSPWTKTVFEGRKPDFWNMGQKSGRVEFVQVDGVRSTDREGSFTAVHRFVDMTAEPEKAALDERLEVTARRGGTAGKPYHVVDLTITQTCATDSPLVLPKYHYGGLALPRPAVGRQTQRNVPHQREGKTRGNGNETTAKWCHVGGKIDGQPAGVTILCHPDNFRFPSPCGSTRPSRSSATPRSRGRVHDRARQAVRREVPLHRRRRRAGQGDV